MAERERREDAPAVTEAEVSVEASSTLREGLLRTDEEVLREFVEDVADSELIRQDPSGWLRTQETLKAVAFIGGELYDFQQKKIKAREELPYGKAEEAIEILAWVAEEEMKSLLSKDPIAQRLLEGWGTEYERQAAESKRKETRHQAEERRARDNAAFSEISDFIEASSNRSHLRQAFEMSVRNGFLRPLNEEESREIAEWLQNVEERSATVTDEQERKEVHDALMLMNGMVCSMEGKYYAAAGFVAPSVYNARERTRLPHRLYQNNLRGKNLITLFRKAHEQVYARDAERESLEAEQNTESDILDFLRRPTPRTRIAVFGEIRDSDQQKGIEGGVLLGGVAENRQAFRVVKAIGEFARHPDFVAGRVYADRDRIPDCLWRLLDRKRSEAILSRGGFPAKRHVEREGKTYDIPGAVLLDPGNPRKILYASGSVQTFQGEVLPMHPEIALPRGEAERKKEWGRFLFIKESFDAAQEKKKNHPE
ncbi:MAG: hypothetical protein HY460_00935 [Parcubacteria group bacterium]|nr:hypothetical protein [Parcubacteria group bacterium]